MCSSTKASPTSPLIIFAIEYSIGEFERLCKLEVETNNPHLVDGARVEYYRQPWKDLPDPQNDDWQE